MRRNWGCRIREITLAGLDALVLENESLRVTVLVGKGGDIVEFCHKPTDTDFVWLSPYGLRNPGDLAGGAADDVAAFTDHYEGGWQEVFPNGGAPCVYRGAALAQHGEVAGLPWRAEIVTDSPDEVAVRLRVTTRRLPYHVVKVLRLRRGAAALDLEEEVSNQSDIALEAMWGHHIVFGEPWLRPGHRIRLPDGVEVIPHETSINPPHRRVGHEGQWPIVWPVVPGPGGADVDLSVVPERGTPSDIVYLTNFDQGWYEIAGSGPGMRVSWDAQTLPSLWMWQEFGASLDHPWWGRAYVLGLEPFAGYPTDGLVSAVANGSAMRIGPRGSRTLGLTAEVINAGS